MKMLSYNNTTYRQHALLLLLSLLINSYSGIYNLSVVFAWKSSLPTYRVNRANNNNVRNFLRYNACFHDNQQDNNNRIKSHQWITIGQRSSINGRRGTINNSCTNLFAEPPSQDTSTSSNTNINDNDDKGKSDSPSNLLVEKASSEINKSLSSLSLEEAFESTVMNRYACTRFHRHQEPADIIQPDDQETTNNETTKTTPEIKRASISNPQILRKAINALKLSQRAPSGFNTQPYKFMIIYTQERKELLAQYCIGRNADRVLDSDCTVLFLADRESVGRDWVRFAKFLEETGGSRRRQRQNLQPTQSDKDGENNESNNNNSTITTTETATTSTTMNPWTRRKLQAIALLFSSALPLPRFISSPITFALRISMATVSILTRPFQKRFPILIFPSLASAETWSTKNTMLVVMTYMLACTSMGLETCPMEGFNVGGIRKNLGIPRRYGLPLIVSTGSAYKREEEEEGLDDAGMAHGAPGGGAGSRMLATARYSLRDMMIMGDELLVDEETEQT